MKKSPSEGLLSHRSSENDKEIDLEKTPSATLSELVEEPYSARGTWIQMEITHSRCK